MELAHLLELWTEITGVSPQEERTTWKISSNHLSDYDVKKMNDNLQNIMKYADSTMVKIMLRNFLLQFLQDRQISLYDLVTDNGKHSQMIDKCRTLLGELKVTEEEKNLQKTVKTALDFYGKDMEIEDINMYDVVSMYVSAKMNMEKLQTVQFRSGRKSKTAPKTSKDVYLFSSIDEVIKGVCSFPENAVMLCYLHDAEESSSSYFCYVIKNEENIYLMGDMPKYAHPYQKFMSRCPARSMEERISKSWFPYSMAGVDLSCRYEVGDEHAKDEDFVLLGKFSSMQTEELLWNTFMLQFIKEKFFDNEYDCPELSFTGNMINTPLLAKNETTLAIYNGFPQVDIPVINSIEETDDLTYGTEKYPHESEHLFADVVERFKDRVDIKECQIYDKGDTTKLITGKDGFGREKTTDLLNVNTNSFGTAQEIERLSKWALRFNFATKINQLAKEEYEKTAGGVSEWYKNKVKENLPSIIERAIKNEFKGKMRVTHNCYSIGYQTPEDGETQVSLVKKELINSVNGQYYYPGNERKNISECKCLVNGTKGTIVLTLAPYDADDICNILGITKEELPEQIRNWCASEKRNSGNCILDDCDPMDWEIRDYWYKMNFGIGLVLSKKAYNEKRKEYGLPEDKFWM